MLKKGKTRNILDGSLDSALLAVEVYNKPRATFRTEAYVSLMIVAWTRLLHAYFNREIGDRYYEKDARRRFKVIDGERRTWGLEESLKEFNQRSQTKLPEAVIANLRFMQGMRNKIEHKRLDKRDIDILTFGECQAMLLNYEEWVVSLFGMEYALNENLVYSLQFSQMRTAAQTTANRKALSKELQEVTEYVHKFRSALPDNVFASQQYSVKLLLVPKVANTNRHDLAMEFVKWDELKDDDRNAYERVVTIVKDKVQRVEGANVGQLKPKDVLAKVNKACHVKLAAHHHTCLWTIFGIRPKKGDPDPFATDVRFCHYDEPHGDYVYQEAWVEFIVNLIQQHHWTADAVQQRSKANERLDVSAYKT